MKKLPTTPLLGLLTLSGWHGTSVWYVAIVGLTPCRFRIQAITRTRLAGRGRYLEPGKTALVPLTAVQTVGGPIELERYRQEVHA